MTPTFGIPLGIGDPADEVDPVFWETVLDISDPWGGDLERLVLEHVTRPAIEPATAALRLVAS